MSMPPYGVKPGRRKKPPHRCDSVLHALGWTLFSAIAPGAGLVHNRRQRLGLLVLLVSFGGLLRLAVASPHSLRSALDLAFDPSALTRAAVMTSVCVALWVAVVVGTFVALRPPRAPRTHLWGASALVGVVCLSVVAPVGLVVRDAVAQAGVVNAVFTHNATATRPHVTQADPWGGRSRVNVLLLGGDSGPHRDGTRTDTMMLASLDTRTGRTVTFGLPRNLMNAPFPEDSPLHALYPDGFRGPGDPAAGCSTPSTARSRSSIPTSSASPPTRAPTRSSRRSRG